MGSRRRVGRFAVEVAVRAGALFATLMTLVSVLASGRLVVVPTLLAGAALLQGWLLVRAVQRSNRELSRFLGAIRYDDYQQSFAVGQLDSSFAELAGAFEEVMARFRQTRRDREAQRLYLEALVEHVPVAILSLREGGEIELVNSAARRLLNSPVSLRLEQLVEFGAAFQRDIAQSRGNQRALTRIDVDGVERRLILSTTQMVVVGAPVRLITLEDIQSELSSSEMAAWQDMAQVLSHEIMNSLTPIASLARTADEMVRDLVAGAAASEEALADLEDAVQTLSRRSDGLMRFVSSYRQFTQMPPPTLRLLALSEYFARLERLLVSEWQGRGLDIHMGSPADGLTIMADDSLLDQALINLVRNAVEAALASERPQVWLEARLSERGRPIIEVSDNGPGVEASLGEKIFLPFFTTKAAGSGIGLALARQVMLMHGGALTAASRPGGGALFRLTF
jgi:two-component system nitrogen regulation sensor histidine kinase NtrY